MLWANTAGINAGCMLLAPDSRELDQMLEEIEQDDHPSHCEAPGPEQDYLSRSLWNQCFFFTNFFEYSYFSRYYADQWVHLSPLYNFQLHHLYYHLTNDEWGSNNELHTCEFEDIKVQQNITFVPLT